MRRIVALASLALLASAPHVPTRAETELSHARADLQGPPRISLPGTAAVTRGPYLQIGTPDSIVVHWRTDAPTSSRVLYGPAPGNLTSSVENPILDVEHAVPLTGLSADTRYYYAIGTTSEILAGDDALHFFETSPVAGTPKATRIWVLGDSGTGNMNAMAVRDAYYTFAGTDHTHLWLMLGDNAYPNGTDLEYQQKLFDIYPEMLRKSVLWPTIGNHDLPDPDTQTWPYLDIFQLPTQGEAGGEPSASEEYYSFDFSNIHFVVLNSMSTSLLPGGPMLTWLEADLADTTQEWVIAFWHHPPYTKAAHDSDDPLDSNGRLIAMRQNALPILEFHGVDLVLTGHSHSYERSYLIDGHYGDSTEFGDPLTSPFVVDSGDGSETGDGAYQKPAGNAMPPVHDGTVYTVAGSSGLLSPGPMNHPAMVTSLQVLGSVVLDVDSDRLEAKFLDNTGAVQDDFVIIKSCPSDSDGDTVCDAVDNCVADPNPDQENSDGDAAGDVCDVCPNDPLDDSDGDLVCAGSGFNPPATGDLDNCPDVANPSQVDTDGDGDGDACDADMDNDGVTNAADPAPLDPDLCGDVDGDTCDDCAVGTDDFGPLGDSDPSNDGPDNDGDGYCQAGDACDNDPDKTEPGICGCGVPETDTDSFDPPDCLDDDDDNDGVPDGADPAPLDPDVCGDSDGDTCDDCAVGTDNFGPAADADPGNDGPDSDGDGTCDAGDLCPDDPGKIVPGGCGCGTPDTDTDSDATPDCTDVDDDNDGILDGADPAPLDPDVCGDSDGDTCDDCAVGVDDFGPAPDADPANDGPDDDSDGICDVADPCLADPYNDVDSDGVCTSLDNCPTVANTNQEDADGDGIGDVCRFVPVGGQYISSTEVTNEQYVVFLNAVGDSDPNGLYNTKMGTEGEGGISRTGSDGSYVYTIRENMDRKPVNFLSWLDAIRYVNWLHNGQPTGLQDVGLTETGAYDLTGPGEPVRDADAQWFLPSRPEWEEAAYSDPSKPGGWIYPTRSDAAPTQAQATPEGDVDNPGLNTANYERGADWNGKDGNVTTVAGAGPLSTSYWGTHDQGGNIGEWTETAEAGGGQACHPRRQLQG